MKKFYIAIFIFSVCFLDINPALKSKAFSLKDESLISLNDKNISKNLTGNLAKNLTKNLDAGGNFFFRCPYVDTCKKKKNKQTKK